MIVAALERFSDPSRRLPPREIAAAGDEVLSWELPHPFEHPLDALRRVPGALRAWLRLPATQRTALLRACLGTGGARAGALLRAPELLERLRRGEADALAVFSREHFALATYLATAAGVPCNALLDRGTQYFGEFAFELLAVVPYAYWLHRQGRLEVTISSADTRCLYYFSPRHEERDPPRRYVPVTEFPLGERGSLRFDRKTFPRRLDTARWLPPPYKSVYADDRFHWPRQPCIVCNKHSDEQYLWHRGPANFIDTPTLLELIGRLRTRYQVIYVRSRREDIVPDHQTIHESGDIEAVTRAFPDVTTIQRLQAEHPDLSFNELQLRLFAGCERFVSVLGGSSYLASYFGGTNVVYARRGWEVACGAYENWFHQFSSARVVRVATPAGLLSTVDRELLGAEPTAGTEPPQGETDSR